MILHTCGGVRRDAGAGGRWLGPLWPGARRRFAVNLSFLWVALLDFAVVWL